MRTRNILACLAAVGLVVGAASTAAASVSATPTRPCAQPDGRVDAMAFSGTTLYIGGSFTHVRDKGGIVRNRGGLAAINTITCDVTAWTATADANVAALVASGSKVYVAGSFTHLNGITRNRIAALDAGSADVLAFNPSLDKPVRGLLVTGGKLYAGGEFNKVGGVSRSKLAAWDLPGESLSGAWQPKANGAVDTLAISADHDEVYIGGSFTTLNGQTAYPYLGAVDADSGANDSTFRPTAGYPILDLEADDRGVYAGGGGHGGHLDIYNLDGSHQRPTYQLDGNVQAVAVDGNSLFGGGHFTNYCVGGTGAGAPFICDQNLERRKAVEISLSSGQLTNWAPAFNSPFGLLVTAVDPISHTLWAGGDFTTVNKVAVAHLAAFPCTTC